jgi:hypothetical protein
VADEARLLDCRPARRDSNSTSASRHPKLLIGEFVMRPRIHVALTPNDQIIVSKWSRRTRRVMVTALAAMGVWLLFSPHFARGTTAHASGRPNDAACMSWDATASEAIVAFIQGSGQDFDLKRVSDMIVQMRKARRSCQLGWSNLACEHYRSIIGWAVDVVEAISDTAVACGPATAGAPGTTAEAATRH